MQLTQQQMIIAAALGFAAWFVLKKKTDTTTSGAIGAVTPAGTPAGTGQSIWDGFGVGAASAMTDALQGGGTMTGDTRPYTPTPAQVAQGAPVAVFGGTAASGAAPVSAQPIVTGGGFASIDAEGNTHWPDGTVSKPYRPTAKQTLAVMGY